MSSCPNSKCKCEKCTCGDACTCGISMEVVCDPCIAFKKSLTNSSTKSSGLTTQEIPTLLHRVLLAIDEGNSVDFAQCFAKNGICDVLLIGSRTTGSKALEILGSKLSSRFKGMRHWEGNVCVQMQTTDKGDQHFINRSYWKALLGNTIVSTGIHVDRLVKDNTGNFVIAHRVIGHTYSNCKVVDPGSMSTMLSTVMSTAL